MKKILFYTSLIISLLLSVHSSAQWVQIGPSGGLNVLSLAINGNKIFAGADTGGVYYSSNNGTNWTQTSLTYQLNNQGVYALAINGNNIFAGSFWSGVFLSTNNGQNWMIDTLGMGYQYVRSLAISGNNVFTGTDGHGVFRSTNNGQSWIQTSLNFTNVYSLALNGNNIFAGTGNSGVYLSTNNGQTWTQTSLNNQEVYAFATIGNYVFAGTWFNGVYLSTNNGQTWTQTSLNSENVWTLAILGNNIFAGTNDHGVYYSSNNGANWIQKNEGLENILAFYSLNISSNFIYAGTINSVWKRKISDFIGIKNISNKIPEHYRMFQNYPNPFNPSTIIKFMIAENEKSKIENGIVTLKVYDIYGREISTLVNESLKPGTYEVPFSFNQFSNNRLASGIYFYTLHSESFSETKRMILLK